MSYENVNVMLIRAVILDTCHRAFQEYVAQYFKEINLGGVRYYFAVRVINLSQHNQGKGVAPSHRLDVDAFGRQYGMGREESLSDWINQKKKENPQDIIDIVQSWSDGCVG